MICMYDLYIIEFVLSFIVNEFIVDLRLIQNATLA